MTLLFSPFFPFLGNGPIRIAIAMGIGFHVPFDFSAPFIFPQV